MTINFGLLDKAVKSEKSTSIKYREYLDDKIVLTDLYSIKSAKELVLNMLLGKNYRIVAEVATKEQLFKAYSWLVKVYRHSKRQYGDDWRMKLFKEIADADDEEEKNLTLWLLGLTRKTAVNIGVRKNDYPDYLETLITHYDKFLKALSSEECDDVWLLLMAGAATLNIRGSQKSAIGKRLERVLVRAMLTLLGFRENETFWMNIERDQEVAREVDVEVESKRGRIRIEIGLIERGNQEVVEDKIQRVGRNGVVIFDKVGAKTRIYESASTFGVKLIQIRGNKPLTMLREHLNPLVNTELNKVPKTKVALKRLLDGLPDTVYVESSTT